MDEKFILPYIDFVEENFDTKKHMFFLRGNEQNYPDLAKKNFVKWINKKTVLEFIKQMNKAEKIIYHGLWFEKLLYVIFFQPWLLKKSYHVLWGGDFYFPEKQDFYFMKKKIIKNMGHFITYIRGDYELVKKWYGAKGQYHECIMYPSNLFKQYKKDNSNRGKKNYIAIQVGHSATPNNKHMEIFKKLEKYKNEEIVVYSPLSYGEKDYAEEVSLLGKEIFGEKFKPILDFMPFEKYIEFLSDIDIAIFNHNRQQGMGNIITLLGMGKKVYMRSDITSWEMFGEIGVKVFDVEDEIDLKPIDEKTRVNNIETIKSYFSKENLIKQWNDIFTSV